MLLTQFEILVIDDSLFHQGTIETELGNEKKLPFISKLAG